MSKISALPAVLLLTLSTFLVMTPSNASPDQAASSVTEYRQALVANPGAYATLHGFDALSPAKQRDFVRIMTDPVLFKRNVRYVTSEHYTRITSAKWAPTPSTQAIATATYDVTSWYRVCSTVFGVTNNCGNLLYKYQTRSGSVVSSNACYMYYTGNTTGLSISTQTSHWISGGRGYCDGMATIQFIFRFGWSIAQHGWLDVNGTGIFAAGFANV